MILVTGGTGLIGSHLIYALLKQGRKVRVLKRSTSDTDIVRWLIDYYDKNLTELIKNIDWVEGDVDNYHSVFGALKDVKEVYHCAAMVSFSKSNQNRMLEVNVQGTANMVDASLEHGVKKFCHVSSVASLGSATESEMVDEEAIFGKSKGKSGYAISKFRSEMEVWRGIDSGLNAIIVNPSVVIGPGNWNTGSGLILRTIANGFPFYTLGVTGYVDVRDVVDLMIKGMQNEAWGKRFVINGQNISHRQVFTYIAKAMGKKEPSIRVYPWMSNIAWRAASFVGFATRKTPSLTRDTARSAHTKTYYSAKRAKEQLGIEFTPIAEAVKNAVKAGPF
ncbi:MAG: NAD-dependent epimerase/dehydratase family protein [Bacteroidales bacterium]